jgi:hypothetical protein
MSARLLRALLRLSLSEDQAPESAGLRSILEAATDADWQQSFADLQLHRLVPLVAYSLQTHHLMAAVPADYRTQFQQEYRQTRTQNAIYLLTLGHLLPVLRSHHVDPVLWKGGLLIDSFYPDLGTRSMSDLDFAIAPNEIEGARAAFRDLGFAEQPEKETTDALYFANAAGVLCDVHHRVRLFETREQTSLTFDCPLQRTPISSARTLEPTAMLVLLLVHLDGHRFETGPLLSWIIDFVFVLRQWGHLIQRECLEQLIPAKKHWVSLLKLLRFLEQEFQVPPPAGLADQLSQVRPLTLEEILRQRRLALWELPRPQGWLRLAADRLGVPLKHPRPALLTSDLFLWIADMTQDRSNQLFYPGEPEY